MSDVAKEEHEAAKRALTAAHRAGRMPHALLLTGGAGIGKTRFAEWLVRLRWCTGEAPPCGTCAPCRKVSTRNHPDLVLVRRDPSPEEDPEGWGSKHGITVDQIRHGVRAALALRSVEGGGRSVVLQDADDMNEEAQNALLKTLEEPPAGSLLVLVTTREDALLETVRSRCQEVRLFADSARAGEPLPVWPPTGQDAGQDAGEDTGDDVAGLDPATLTDALDLLLQGELAPAAFASRVRALLDEHAPEVPDAHERALSVLHQRVRDLVLLVSGGDPDAARTSAAVDVARFPSADRLLRAEKPLLEAVEDLRRHVPPHVTWLALGLEIARVGVGGDGAANRYT